VSAVFQNDTLNVSHYNAYYNCCQKITMELEQQDSLLRFVEHPGGDLCHCMCYFDLGADVTGLDPGAYIIQIWDEDGSVLFGQVEVIVTVPALAKDGLISDDTPMRGRDWTYQTEQGTCKNSVRITHETPIESTTMRKASRHGKGEGTEDHDRRQ